MEYYFRTGLELLPETKKKEMIDDLCTKNPAKLNIIYKGRIQKLFPGFRTINGKIPKTKLLHIVEKDCTSNNRLASFIFSNWYKENTKLNIAVKKSLNELGYEINEPDFSRDSLNCKPLNLEDILVVDNVSFYKSHKNELSDFDILDSTIMAFLYGMCVFLEDEEFKKQSLNNILENENVQALKDDNNELLTDNSIVEFDLLEKNIVKLKLYIDEIQKSMDSLKNDIQNYRNEKNNHLATIQSYIQKINNNIFDTKIEHHSKDFQHLKTQHKKCYFKFNKVSENIILNFEEYLDKKVKIKIIENTDFEEELSQFDSIIVQVKEKVKNNIIEYFDNYCDQNISKNNTLKNKYEKQIKTINSNLERFETIDIALLQIKKIESDLIQDNTNVSFYECIKELEKNQNYENLEKLLKSITQDGSNKDLLTYMFILPNKSLAIPNEFYRNIFLAINEAYKKYGVSFLLAINNDSQFRNLLVKHTDGKLFYSLLSLNFIFLDEKEISIANLYYENCYEVFKQYPIITDLVERLLIGQDFSFYNGEDQNLIETIQEYFEKRNERYSKLTTGLDPIYQKMEAKYIFPKLEEIFIAIKTGKKHKIEAVQNELNEISFAEELYRFALKQSETKDNRTLRKRVLKTIETICDLLKKYIVEKLILTGNESDRINFKYLMDEITNVSIENESLEWLCKILINNLLPPKTKVNTFSMEYYLFNMINESIFWIKYVPELINYINVNEFKKEELNKIIVNKVITNAEIESIFQTLINSNAFRSAKIFAKYCNIDETFIVDKEKHFMNELKQLEYALTENNFKYTKELEIIKSQERWNLLNKLLTIEHAKITRRIENSSIELKASHEQFILDVLKNKQIIRPIREKYPIATLKLIDSVLDYLEKITFEKFAKNKDDIEYIKDELLFLQQFKKHSIDDLQKSYQKLINNRVVEKDKSFNLKDISINDLLTNIQDENYQSLGLEKSEWIDISDNRKDDILEALDCWKYLENRPTTYLEVKKSSSSYNIIKKLELLSISLAKICSLLRTNDNNQIGVEPFIEWSKSSESLPFIFTTKIVYPKCHSLNKQIRLYFFSNPSLNNRRIINSVRDYIQDKGYDNSSYSIIVVMGDIDQFQTVNTNSITRNMPVLDFEYLKKIILSVQEKRLPKWEFASLITHSQDISSIQPFHFNGLITSENNIFVGRKDIIRKFIMNPRDFAIYGGRRVGKSSLMIELKNQLRKNGFVTVYDSFQGDEDPLNTMRTIYQQLAKYFEFKIEDDIKNYDDVKTRFEELYETNRNQEVAIFLDEVDEYIIKEEASQRHTLIEIFRALSQRTARKWRFIFAGFKKMYVEIHRSNIYKGDSNPWRNFLDDLDGKQKLSELDSPKDLIDEGLKNILDLQCDQKVSNRIVNYSTGHPAFLQKFLSLLIDKRIKRKVEQGDRVVQIEDV
ncbi:MAG: hypothetical protein H6627_04585, partial [Calditrichae bacterium]|nr:hypothetical protein [Calditrichia bacterium]